MRVLSLSTLFPAPPRPSFGRFVANQMDGVAALAGVDLVMINPIGLPPWPLRLRAPYAALAQCPPTSQLGALTVHHPRFGLRPLVGGDSNPARIARAVLPLARRLHAQTPFDLVDAQFFFPDGPAAALVAQDLGVPLTIKARGSDIHYWSTRPKALAQILAAGQQATALLSVSAALGRDMVALGMAEGSIRVHYTGLDRERFSPTPRPVARAALAERLGLALPPQAPLLVCPGALIAIKGQALALDALALLPGAHLALAGTGPHEATYRAQAASLGLADRVHFLGQVGHNDLPLLMSAADAVVLPSEREGLANVWIEALACGTPLVVPAIGGAAEVVTSASAGRLAERNPQAIAKAVRALLAAPPAQSDVAACVAGFSWQANAQNLLAIWQQATGR
jgi:teichuronic acid biosynthesis glycosyltransferase TuaC